MVDNWASTGCLPFQSGGTEIKALDYKSPLFFCTYSLFTQAMAFISVAYFPTQITDIKIFQQKSFFVVVVACACNPFFILI